MFRYIRSMHSTSKLTCSDRTSATVRGSVMTGSGRTGRKATYRQQAVIPGHSVPPHRSGQSHFHSAQHADMARRAGVKPRWGVFRGSWDGVSQPDPDRRDVDGALVHELPLVITGRDGTELLELAEVPLKEQAR